MDESNKSQLVEYQTKAPIIETIGISKVYKIGKQMVNPVTDISLQVGYGDFAVIFGLSGAGKSTLLNILMGLESPDIGEVFIKNNSLYAYSEEERTVIRRKKIGYIPQNQYWINHMNILDNVALPLILEGTGYKKAREKATKLLYSVGLSGRVRHKPYELSSGQQQKASIARALIKDPWLVFADEPTAHLDSESVKEVSQILVDANKKFQVTIIMVTHDFEFLKLSKKWFLMRDGRLWDIKDRKNPFRNLKEAIDYIATKPEDEHAT